MHWWCYIGFEELFRAVYHRPINPEEKERFKKMNRDQRNDWVLQHVGLTNGMFCAIDQRMENGYVAFTTLPYFFKGILDGDIVIPEGKTEFVIPHSGSSKWGFSVERTGMRYKIVSWWDNGGLDHGQTTIELDEKGDLHNYRIDSPKLAAPAIYNWQTRSW